MQYKLFAKGLLAPIYLGSAVSICRIRTTVPDFKACTVKQVLADENEASGKADASDETIQNAFVAFLRLYSETYDPVIYPLCFMILCT